MPRGDLGRRRTYRGHPPAWAVSGSGHPAPRDRVTGSAPDDARQALAAVQGVASVDEQLTHRLPPPDAPVQYSALPAPSSP